MAVQICEIFTPYISDGENNRPQLIDDYPLLNGEGWIDKTEQSTGNIIPDPNLISIWVRTSSETIALIEADDNYMVLWSADITAVPESTNL